MGWFTFFRRRGSLPAALAAALDPDERVLARAALVGGDGLVATRFGLWWVPDGALVSPPERWGWDRISKAVFVRDVLSVVVADELAVWPDGTVVLRDRKPRNIQLAEPSGLTDVVHTRVRRSVAASAHLPWPGGGGWVVQRRVPGRDGLTVQLRVDPGVPDSVIINPDPGLVALVVAAAAHPPR